MSIFYIECWILSIEKQYATSALWGFSNSSIKTGAKNGKDSAKKQSNTVKGRKRKYLDDGSWIWEYPKK